MLRHYDVYEQVNYGVYMPKKRESFMDNEQENRENTILGNNDLPVELTVGEDDGSYKLSFSENDKEYLPECI